ncbi:MAG: DUF3422 domain-containing protein [Pseudomonadales bacterium]|uniref:Multipass membrane protein n=1 Tax=Oleiphilus messinensis TaxID=141451 RepID=A0A1Y0I2S3_9GAMM|nr:DUF3422 domain-containing protein [Oleiphilus messinensis]ARU54509.1 multipass membrane protein [Oleiphilus messinensis]MCG8613950.1 DUF3422 domain-containing protein [Pseudomonadales bacterium]
MVEHSIDLLESTALNNANRHGLNSGHGLNGHGEISGPVPSVEPLFQFFEAREALYNELHTRPFPVIETPASISQLAILHEESGQNLEFDHLSQLSHRYAVNPPAPGASCFYQNFGGFELRWERHTEFSSYTFIHKLDAPMPFGKTALSLLPPEWLKAMPGKVISCLHVELQAMPPEPQSADDLRQCFEGHRLISSSVEGGRAQLWTSYRIHSDGFGRILLQNRDLNACQTGRLVRRLLEIETYRMMVLMAFPLAKRIAPEVQGMERDLAAIIQQITDIEGLDDERRLLGELSTLAARVEQMITDTNYRFSASEAYFALVESRLDELREAGVNGLQTVGEFLSRRLVPAYRTAETVKSSLMDLSKRIERASELIRTRVNVTIESQNRYLLQSMDRRSKLQLRMQQAVEGLSVAVITYHLVGLVKHLADSAESLGWIEHAALWVGASVPVCGAVVVLGLMRLKKRISQTNEIMKEKQRSIQ